MLSDNYRACEGRASSCKRTRACEEIYRGLTNLRSRFVLELAKEYKKQLEAKEKLLHAKEFVLELAKEKLEQAQELEHAKEYTAASQHAKENRA